MKIIDVVQGSPEWKAWRKTVITATDCPAIKGSSRFLTPYKCWQKKLDLIEEEKSNDAMERGKRLEPIIRERFIEKYGINMTPICGESSEYNFLGASFDGVSDCGKYIWECKTGGDKLYSMAEKGIIPSYYMDQIQHQLLVSEADKCFYHVGHEDAEKDIVIEVYPEFEFAKTYMPFARAFWKCVAFAEPPTMQDSDYKDMSDDPEWNKDATEYCRVIEQLKNLEEVKENYRKKFIGRCGDQSCLGHGIKVQKSIIRGRVDYDAIPEIKSMNLNMYRKAPTTTWKIFVS